MTPSTLAGRVQAVEAKVRALCRVQAGLTLELFRCASCEAWALAGDGDALQGGLHRCADGELGRYYHAGTVLDDQFMERYAQKRRAGVEMPTLEQLFRV